MLIANKNQKISQDERMIREQLLLHPPGARHGSGYRRSSYLSLSVHSSMSLYEDE
jgi:hypothetical protein